MVLDVFVKLVDVLFYAVDDDCPEEVVVFSVFVTVVVLFSYAAGV